MSSERAGRIHWLVTAIWMIGLFTLQFVAQHARAEDKLWNLPVNGVFTLASNWFGGVPGQNDVARFETSNSSFQNTYTVSFANDPINQQLVVEDDNVTFNLIGVPSNHTYTLTNEFVAVALGTVPNRSGNLTVRRGTLNLPNKNPASATDLEIAPVANATGVLTVGVGGGIVGGPDVFVGLNGNGTLNINSGGGMIANRVHIGFNDGSTGRANIAGGGSSLFATNLSVNKGELNVTAEADVVSVSGSVNDVATIDGTGSTWDVSSQLEVGIGKVGTLNITGGGRVTSGRVFIGLPTINTTSVGQVNVASTIPGAESIFSISEFLDIGNFTASAGHAPMGTLLIQAGGTVNVASVIRLYTLGSLRLEGGTLNTNEMGIDLNLSDITDQFSWAAGTLRVGTYHGDLSVPNAGVMQPVRAVMGTTVKGDYGQQTPGATLAVEVGGPFQFTDFGVLTVEGTASLGGNLQINLTNGFIPTNVNAFDILRAEGGITGSFANVANGQRLFTADGLGSFLVNYGPENPNPNHVILSAFQVGGIPGDYNQNGTVDAADYVVWRNNLGSGTSLANDDTPGVGPDDYTRWRAHFGQTFAAGNGSSESALSTVPEPAALILMILAGVGGYHYRRRFTYEVPGTHQRVRHINKPPV